MFFCHLVIAMFFLLVCGCKSVSSCCAKSSFLLPSFQHRNFGITHQICAISIATFFPSGCPNSASSNHCNESRFWSRYCNLQSRPKRHFLLKGGVNLPIILATSCSTNLWRATFTISTTVSKTAKMICAKPSATQSSSVVADFSTGSRFALTPTNPTSGNFSQSSSMMLRPKSCSVSTTMGKRSMPGVMDCNLHSLCNQIFIPF